MAENGWEENQPGRSGRCNGQTARGCCNVMRMWIPIIAAWIIDLRPDFDPRQNTPLHHTTRRTDFLIPFYACLLVHRKLPRSILPFDSASGMPLIFELSPIGLSHPRTRLLTNRVSFTHSWLWMTTRRNGNFLCNDECKFVHYLSLQFLQGY